MNLLMIYLFLFILGVCLGSFANVLINRSQSGKSIKGRSKCDSCNYQLRWFDNIPIVSFFLLKRRCKKCGEKLSWQYPLVEFSTGSVFLLTFILSQKIGLFGFDNLNLESSLNLGYYLITVYLLWIILIWDFKYMIIPDFLVVIGVVLTFFYQIYQTISVGNYLDVINNPLIGSLLGGIILSGFFGLLYWYSKGKWIGGGDVKLGFWLGFLVGIKMIYFLILLAYTSGAIIAVFLLATSKKGMKSEIPFGPFLIISTYFVLFYQDWILKIWRNLI